MTALNVDLIVITTLNFRVFGVFIGLNSESLRLGDWGFDRRSGERRGSERSLVKVTVIKDHFVEVEKFHIILKDSEMTGFPGQASLKSQTKKLC